MTEDMLRTVLDSSNGKMESEGWHRLPEHQLLTMYAAHDGVQLTVAKVEAVRVDKNVVRARTTRGETFFLALEDLFAVAVDGNPQQPTGRKAGFLG
jgi:hypothetical protein